MLDPEFRLFRGSSAERARVTTLRQAVTPLLAVNYLNHFTDHSVNHSDRLCELIDALAARLGESNRLTNEEAQVLYFAAYLHDSGMQFEKAGNCTCVQAFLKGHKHLSQREWDHLERSTQQEIVRDLHNLLSAELVNMAVGCTKAAIGLPLTEADRPKLVAALCEAHCLDTQSPRYKELIVPNARIRVPLLSALLRIADILDESCERSHLQLEAIHELPPDSALHWWRHYYVKAMSLNGSGGAIEVWFDFPPERRSLYQTLFEEEQLNRLREELNRHSATLAPLSLMWHIQPMEVSAAQSESQPMSQELEDHAVLAAAHRRTANARSERLSRARQLKLGRIDITKQLGFLREPTTEPAEALTRALALADQLRALGGHREAWMHLEHILSTSGAAAPSELRQMTATRLAEMMLEEGAVDSAMHLVQGIAGSHERPLGESDTARALFRVWCQILRDTCVYTEAIEAFGRLKAESPDPNDVAWAQAEIAEIELLQGITEQSA